jgi:hypothetical protein
MTTEPVASDYGGSNQPLSVGLTLNLCDRILKELGRRQHLFAWLRAPGAGPEEWLRVDAYYPGNRLVVVWHDEPGPNDHVYSELIPARGLRLLELKPSDVDAGPGAAEPVLRRMIDALGPAPERPGERQLSEAARTARPASTEKPERRPVSAGAGVLAGLALALVLLVEIYLGVVRWALDGGHLILAFGLALDVCARGLGTLAASRASEPEWAWWCALGGSPVVAGFALSTRSEPDRAEPAPLAGLLSALSLAALALALVVAAL